MSRARAKYLDPTLRWIGRRSLRETGLLWTVWIVMLICFLGDNVVWGSWQGLDRERVRFAASQVSLQELEQLLERRDQIMTRAAGLIGDYLESQRLEASTLLLQRIDRSRTEGTQLVSVYPLGSRTGDPAIRFRANLVGSPGSLARLFFALGEGAPPIVLRELALTADRRSRSDIAATALLEVEQQALPEECVRLLDARTEAVDAQPATVVVPPFPYKAIDRRGVFETARRRESGQRLTEAAPTIENLMRQLALVGVIWNEEPQAIIADRAENQTHYRKVGQFIGELEVIEITRSAVTLRYKDEEGRLE